jgi:hypothetical protein
MDDKLKNHRMEFHDVYFRIYEELSVVVWRQKGT